VNTKNRARRARHWRRGARSRRTEDGRRILLGGVFRLSDRALAVGDYGAASSNSRRGQVVETSRAVGSTRTLEQTLLSIPRGTLSAGERRELRHTGKDSWRRPRCAVRLRHDCRSSSDRYSPGFSVSSPKTRRSTPRPRVSGS
jgi:hypothetical protein